MASIDEAVGLIRARRAAVSAQRTVVAAVSGIDGSGKGYITERIVAGLGSGGGRAAVLHLDDWLELPDRRFSTQNPAAHFYERGFRFQEMLDKVVGPLRERRSLRLEADLADATLAPTYRRHVYDFRDVDFLLVEGIFLLKPAFRGSYDFTIWIDCSFATALERALQRNQEGLPPDEIVRDFEAIYFPAQAIHQEKDNPRASADMVIVNDPRLEGGGGAVRSKE